MEPISHAELVAEAERRGMPGRTLADVQACIAKCKKSDAAEDMARLMLRFGRLQSAARDWLSQEYPQGK
jgi:hypothetical protein